MSTYIYTGKEKERVLKSIALIQNELRNLDVPRFSHAYKLVMENAVEASEIMSKKQLKKYIKECLETLPSHYF